MQSNTRKLEAMKKIFIVLVTGSIFFASCKNNGQSTKKDNDNKKDTTGRASVNDIMAGYLDLKNALANDNSHEASIHARAISGALEKFDKKTLSPQQISIYNDLEDDIKENAEHISTSEIDHQREHFQILSEDMYQLLNATGTNQTLYIDFCPMYDKGNGAIWISEIKEIKNPYMGSKMPSCGSIKKEISKEK